MPQTAPRAGTWQGSRPRWWTELPLIAVVYAAYSAGRLLARGDVSTAVGHGLGILHLEQRLNVDFETPLNDIFTTNKLIGIPADFAYASLHYVVTPAILAWLWKRRRAADYRLLRTWLLVSTLIGLVGFTLMPTCPPRLLDAGHGFVDTMAQYSSYGWWGGEASAPRGLGGLTNQYAAMPSLHVGWALWCGVVLWRHGRSVWAKAVGIVYPLSIALVVMGTANHYFLDAVAGAAVMGVGLLLAKPALRLTARIRARLGSVRPSKQAAGTAAPAVNGASNLNVASNVGDKCETSARERERIPRQQGRDADRGTVGDRSGREAEAAVRSGSGGKTAAAGDGAAAAAR
ncbi:MULTISPECIES: phosphatase PAP2 family protein [unclassified Streptomyces]|uniref:phosphatase PAP2 family protein n=1 Tax=unclassified Streptomyces TaxID=2593676 RepID=UPI00336AA515